ncbi:MAG: hypothetical protein NC341_13360 [Blautia sp.]|nr:hypothetical protein [Blautia sp.]
MIVSIYQIIQKIENSPDDLFEKERSSVKLQRRRIVFAGEVRKTLLRYANTVVLYSKEKIICFLPSGYCDYGLFFPFYAAKSM